MAAIHPEVEQYVALGVSIDPDAASLAPFLLAVANNDRRVIDLHKEAAEHVLANPVVDGLE